MAPQPKRLDQEEEEVVPAIRHEDAEWKIIQQNTFTRWVNNHLQKAGESIGSLETDFSDGLKLIHLAQVLSHKMVGKYNKKVNFRSQKLENVSLALNFFQNEENIKIINIDSTHIVDHNKKLILDLVWTLILHYSVSMGWIQEKRDDGETPKQKLLNWMRNRLPGMQISNFTSDWNDGVALGALVDSMAPGALNDRDEWSPNDALQNTEKAMKTARDLLKVAPLIAPAEMIHPEIDEMSVMTYLSQFPATKPIILKPKVQAVISDLDKTLIVNEPRIFDLKLSREGYKPKVSIKDSEGQDVRLGWKKINQKTYKIGFTPTKLGPLYLEVAAADVHTFETQQIPEASMTCQVVPTARLLEYRQVAKVGDDIKFTVIDALEGAVKATVVYPSGRTRRMDVVEGSTAGEHSFEFKMLSVGWHRVYVDHNKQPLTGSPYLLRGIPKTVSRQSAQKGHDFERIKKQFTKEDIGNFKPKEMFHNKWIVLRVEGWRGDACCYFVCDKSAKKFGYLYLEISEQGMSTLANQIEFSHRQYSIGNSHRFTTVIDCGVINNHVYYMVLNSRPGASLPRLLKCVPQGLSPVTVAFIAVDMISLVELLASTGYVLRNYDPNQWFINAKSRQFYLGDTTDIVVISDKRYCPINPLHFESADQIDLHWSSEDLTYAPIAFISDGPAHRMSELDLMETMLYVIYELAYNRLPWKNSRNPQKTLQLKKDFMDAIPRRNEEVETLEANWLHVALQNTLEYIKEAHKDTVLLEKLPVRDGAWCPNGARAGALISAVKYREILEDFNKVVTSGRPSWSVNPRDVMLDWERRIEHTEKSRELQRKFEIRQRAWEIIRETERLDAKRTHYEIMMEHGKAELAQNAVAIDNYLAGRQDEEDVEKKPAKKEQAVRRTRNSRKEEQEEEDDLELVKKPKEENEEAKEKDDADANATTATNAVGSVAAAPQSFSKLDL